MRSIRSFQLALLVACTAVSAQPAREGIARAESTGNRQSMPAASASREGAVVSTGGFTLEPADRNVRTAFTRWAQRRGVTLQWLLTDDIPIDAPGLVVNTYPDLVPAQFAASRDPALVEAMTVVAHAFSASRSPFVVREYGNTIVVQPRLAARQ
jgi:hypothetical protein